MTDPLAANRGRRWRACLVHIGCSAIVVLVAALVVLLVWFPPPFASIAGGTSLLLLLMSVDFVIGPALTAVVASPSKPRKVLQRDVFVIVVLQVAAFVYGMFTVSVARPVALAFEMDLFRVVTAADVDDSSLDKAPAASLRKLSWTGPKLLSAVRPANPEEQLRTIDLGMAGVHLSNLPQYWRPYEESRAAVLSASRPVVELAQRYPKAQPALEEIARVSGGGMETLRFLPLVSRQATWVTIISAADARVVGHLPFDGFK
jgi:NADH:ubiquinone oxidoreductase subunit K